MGRYGLVCTDKPSIEPITLTEAKAHLRVTASDEDELITALITAAREWAEGRQNRAYTTQAWQLWLDGWPYQSAWFNPRTGEHHKAGYLDYIELPLPPLQSVSSVKYYGTNDTEYTMPAADYFVDTKSVKGRVVLGYGKTWPSTTLRPANSVCVTFVAGYGAAASNVPQTVKQAMLLAIGTWYGQRESITVGTVAHVAPHAAEMLLDMDRIVPV